MYKNKKLRRYHQYPTHSHNKLNNQPLQEREAIHNLLLYKLTTIR